MNKFDVLSRSQILIAIHDSETELLKLARNSKAFTRCHTRLQQLFLALHRKDEVLLKIWRDAPDNNSGG